MPGPLAWLTNPFDNKASSTEGDVSNSRVEPKTGIEFKGEFCSRAKQSACPRFTGAGARLKNIAGIKVKVYAAGVYVDTKATKKVMGFKSHMAPVTQVVESDEIEKTIQLVFARGVKGPTVLAAFDERLKPKLAGTDELATFRGYFDNVSLAKGEQLSFTADHGVLTTKKNNKTIGAINSPKLCRALFDIYLGNDPVIGQLKDDVATNLSKLAFESR